MPIAEKNSKKTKILRIIARLNIGGPAINVSLLTAGLDRERYETVLVSGSTERDEGDMSYLLREKGLSYRVIPQLSRRINPLNDIIAFLRIFLLICRERPDIIHTHTAKAGALGRLAGLLIKPFRRLKLVHTFHGHIFDGYFPKAVSRVFVIIERHLARGTDAIIVVSEAIKREILALGIGDEQKVKVVHLGFELERFLKISLRNDSVLNIGMVGRLAPIKNHKMFLDGAKLTLKAIRRPASRGQAGTTQYAIRFLIIGDGQLRRELEEYAAGMGIKDRVEFSGWQRDIAEVYGKLDIVALTSLNEGTPVSLIEAMAASRPVVATDVGGVRDLVGSRESKVGSFTVYQRGVLVASGDAKSFADGLGLLANDAHLRQRLGAAGREFAREEFDKRLLIKNTEMVYNRLAAGST